jgi:hypothetical protein
MAPKRTTIAAIVGALGALAVVFLFSPPGATSPGALTRQPDPSAAPAPADRPLNPLGAPGANAPPASSLAAPGGSPVPLAAGASSVPAPAPVKVVDGTDITIYYTTNVIGQIDPCG